MNNIQLPKEFTTVTTMSKLLALLLFVSFPIIGFALGMQYKTMVYQSAGIVVTPTPPVGGGIMCPEDMKTCPDGSYVGRNPPNCEFDACPVYPSPTDNQVKTISPTPASPKNNQDVKGKKTFSNQWMFSFEYPSNWLIESGSNTVYLYAPNSSNPDAGRLGSYPRINVNSESSTNLDITQWFNDNFGLDPNLPRTGSAPTIRKTFSNTHGVSLLEVDAFTNMGTTQYYFKSGNNVIILTPLYKQAENGGLLHDQDQVYKDIIDSITLM